MSHPILVIGRAFSLCLCLLFKQKLPFLGLLLPQKRESVYVFLHRLVVDANPFQVPFIQAVDTFVDFHLVVPSQAVQLAHIR